MDSQQLPTTSVEERVLQYKKDTLCILGKQRRQKKSRKNDPRVPWRDKDFQILNFTQHPRNLSPRKSPNSFFQSGSPSWRHDSVLEDSPSIWPPIIITTSSSVCLYPSVRKLGTTNEDLSCSFFTVVRFIIANLLGLQVKRTSGGNALSDPTLASISFDVISSSSSSSGRSSSPA